MNSKLKRLGSLADIYESESLEGTIRKIKLSKIIPAQKQPRSNRTKGIEELAKSLKNEGLLQSILVTKKENIDSYTIIAGERRYHAAKLLGWEEIECKILNKNEKEVFKLAIIENLQREDISPIDEVEALKTLKNTHNYTDQELADLVGKSRNYISEILSISILTQKEIENCENVGINNKNLLIQATLAKKRGNLDNFIEKYQTGEVKTVKDAKEYQKQQIQKNVQATDSNSNVNKFFLHCKENHIHIESNDPDFIKRVHQWLLIELKRF